MRFTFTPGAGSMSKVVITGPGRTSTTLPGDAEVGELRLEDLRAAAQRFLVDAADRRAAARASSAQSAAL